MIFSLTSQNMLLPADEDTAPPCDALIVLVADGLSTAKAPKKGVAAVLAQALKAGHWSTDAGKTLALYQPAAGSPARVLLVGIGQGQADDVHDNLHKAAAAFADEHARLAVCFAQPATAQQLRSAMLALGNAGYAYAARSGKKDRPPKGLHSVLLALPNANEHQTLFVHMQALLAGLGVTRDWANHPANMATPSALAEAAQHIVQQANAMHKSKAKSKAQAAFTCEALEPDAIRALGMGAFLAVAKGSDEPARFIILQYTGADASEQPLVFVGKGITFDSGGISLKPGAAMDEMKFDMSGAASVLGLFEALRHLRPAINVVGLIPTCENLPSGHATKPGDVVTSMSGQTIEVLNTDAEGRLILCDALTYAECFHPRAVVDIATLTGNCLLALGKVRSGLFTTHDALACALQDAADTSRDLCWRMPMDNVYAKGLKSRFADMANIAGRTAGAISAAKFLEKFATSYPWAHLDIAGTAWNDGASKGATGRPLPLLLQFVLDMAQHPQAWSANTGTHTHNTANAPAHEAVKNVKTAGKTTAKRAPAGTRENTKADKPAKARKK